MQDFLERWLFDPTVGKIIVSIVGVLIIAVIVRFLHRSLARHLRDPDVRYRVRKLITFAGYLAGILFITVVFSDRLGHLTVAFGVAGAGVAFALQEVIASIAGWVAVSLGHFYQIGDRVQLGGIMGDVIDIGVLRTTLMECGQWVNSDLYNGRIVRIANSFVFKEPVFNYSADFPFLWDEVTVPVTTQPSSFRATGRSIATEGSRGISMPRPLCHRKQRFLDSLRSLGMTHHGEPE